MAEEQIQHFLVPKHIRLTDEQKREILKKLNVSIKQLPMIKVTDPALKDMNCKVNDLILIKRKSQTAKEADYYRVVIDG